MGSDPHAKRRADDEAAQWFSRPNAAAISTAELAEFRLWRQDPTNEAAFHEVERVWRASASLKDDPALRSALADARSRNHLSPSPRWRSATGLGVGLASVVVAGIAAVLLSRQIASLGDVYQTAVGERRTVALADGSRVSLDTDSRIVVRYTAKERRISLSKGQALFDVVHQAKRPLQVDAGETRIVDLGTRFDVRREDGRARVTVVEGSVTVGDKAVARSWTLVAGQQVLTGQVASGPYAVDPAKATSWTSGRLLFEETPLSTATSEMNRYGAHPVVLRAGEIGAIKVNGAFDTADTAAFVAAVTRLYDLRAQTQPDGTIVLSRSRADPDA